MSFDNLPTLAQQSSRLAFKPQPKGKSRLELKEDAAPLIVVDEKAFLKAVRARYQRAGKLYCAKCLARVLVQLARAARRAEVHHLYGRRGDFRFDDRFAILVCMACHEQLTGKVNEKWVAVATVGTVFIEIKGREYIDARGPIAFERAA